MTASADGNDPAAPNRRGFHTTRWSLVQRAGRPEPGGEARVALEELCEAYWYPLYAYVRRSGRDVEEARDLTQSFFVRLLEKREFSGADPERGRFRTYLLQGLRFFLSHERERELALKRGGGRVPVSLELDFDGADTRYRAEVSHEDTPERAFQRAWAEELLARVQSELAEEYAARGQAERFEALQPLLAAAGDGPTHAELATRLGLSEGGSKVALHRLRQRFGDRLRDAVAETVTDASDVDEELRSLLAVLGN